MAVKYLFLILLFLFFSCNRDFLLPHPDELNSTHLLPLDLGKSWSYGHSVVDTLTMGAIYSDTVKWPTFAFRPGKYLIAIDRFPTPPYHFWRIIF